MRRLQASGRPSLTVILSSLDPLKSRDRKWILVVLVCAALLFQSTNMLSLAMPARTVETKAQRTSLDELFPIMLPDKDDVYQDENNRAMRALVRCMTEDNCTKNQKSVVLLSSSHFAAHLVGYVSGEHIWYVARLLISCAPLTYKIGPRVLCVECFFLS